MLCSVASPTDTNQAVCVRVNFVAHASAQLKDRNVKIACVIGFHEGTHPTASKISEAQNALAAGATELDVVLNREALQSGDLVSVFEELHAIRQTAPSATLKLILETSQLGKGEIVAAGVVAGYAGWEFIKTSTGFCGGGATVENVLLMGRVAEVVAERSDAGGKGKMKVKASGGVRSLEDARKMLNAGAERIGASAGVAIIKEFLGQAGGDAAKSSGGY